MKKRMNGATIAGIVCIFVFGSQLAVLAFQPKDIWWTPMKLALSPEAARDRVRVYVHGKPLAECLQEGSLMVREAGGAVRELQPDEVRLRLNNWPERRGDFYGMAILPSVGVTLGVVSIVLGLFVLPRIGGRKDAGGAG